MSTQVENPAAEYVQTALLAKLQRLSPEQQQEVLAFAEFLAYRAAQSEEKAIPRTETEPTRQDRVRVRQSGEEWPDTKRLLEHQWLAEHSDEYVGQWVALEGCRLISSGTEARQVFAQVKEAGVSSPFVIYIEGPGDLPFGGW